MLKFKALADATRLRLVNILSRYELSVNELATILGGQSRISRHLKVLAEAGLLRSRREGQWVYYSSQGNTPNAPFLKAILPFLPKLPVMEADLLAARNMLEERARQFFNDVAPKWDDLHREVVGDLDLPARVAAMMPEGCGIAVDLGCGTGQVLAGIAGRTARLIGVDASQAMLEVCARRLAGLSDNLSLRIGEITHAPLANGEAEFACINFVLHHLPVPAAVFPEIARILIPGGILLITDFLRHEDESMRFRHGDYWLGFEPAEILGPLENCGFEIIAVETWPCSRGLKVFFATARLAENSINNGAKNDQTP